MVSPRIILRRINDKDKELAKAIDPIPALAEKFMLHLEQAHNIVVLGLHEDVDALARSLVQNKDLHRQEYQIRHVKTYVLRIQEAMEWIVKAKPGSTKLYGASVAVLDYYSACNNLSADLQNDLLDFERAKQNPVLR